MTRMFRWIASGPSPRARGKLTWGYYGGAMVGSIPAGAGEAAQWQTAVDAMMVHPRGRGGSPDKAAQRRLALRPSPRARGKPSLLCH